MYWIVDDDVNDDEDCDDESEKGDRFGEGAQWTEFFVAGVAAMEVNDKGASDLSQSRARVHLISIN